MTKVVIESGKPLNGTTINTSGIFHKQEYYLFSHFDHSKPPIGKVKNVRLENGELVADCDIEDAALYNYGMAFQIIESRTEPEGRIIDELRLVSVSIIS